MPEPKKQSWLGAMNKEYNSLQKHEVFIWAKAPQGTNVVDCKQVFKCKTLSTGEVIHKASLVARGFSQIYGTDYDQVFSPTVCSEALKVALCQAGV